MPSTSARLALSLSNPSLSVSIQADAADLCPTLAFRLDDSVEYSVKLNRSLNSAFNDFTISGSYIRSLVTGAYTSSPPDGASGSSFTYFVIPVGAGGLTFRISPADFKTLLHNLIKNLRPKCRTTPGWYRVKYDALILLPSGKYQIVSSRCGSIPSSDLSGKEGWYSSPSDTIMVYLTPTNHTLF